MRHIIILQNCAFRYDRHDTISIRAATIKRLFMNTKMHFPSCYYILLSVFLLYSCALLPRQQDTYVDANMDFGAIQTVAVLPFANLTTDNLGTQRARDAFMNHLLSTEALYVLPSGEVSRALSLAVTNNPVAPSIEEIKRIKGIIKVDAIITGVLREYGPVRSGSTGANVISLSLQMIETETGKVIWSASSTKGGIDFWDRLFGGGGKPMNDVTEDAVNELIDKLFH